MIRTMLGREEPQTETFDAGTLAGAGSFHCEECGFAVALHERDEVPECPRCGGAEFKRSSIFGEFNASQDPADPHDLRAPDWLAETREALDRDGDYIAFDQNGSLRVIALSDGWTRIGRSLSADIRFDDPTVSRRHAMVHRDAAAIRILDDRSLNGVFVNAERIEMRELSDGDQVTIGRFQLHFMVITGTARRDRDRAPGAFA
jgi:predicted RNA-binding Zn-ribbon protein involved in translation (DUF1610 family)